MFRKSLPSNHVYNRYLTPSQQFGLAEWRQKTNFSFRKKTVPFCGKFPKKDAA